MVSWFPFSIILWFIKPFFPLYKWIVIPSSRVDEGERLIHRVLWLIIKMNCHNPFEEIRRQVVWLDFYGATAEANQVSLMGLCFGSIPMADVMLGTIPTDNAYAG